MLMRSISSAYAGKNIHLILTPYMTPYIMREEI
jgi:hypothetical protein